MVGGLGEYSDIILRELAYLTLPSLSLPSERTTPPPTDDLRCSRVAGARWSGNLTEVWLVTCGGRLGSPLVSPYQPVILRSTRGCAQRSQGEEVTLGGHPSVRWDAACELPPP
jgi:hypothetical protein